MWKTRELRINDWHSWYKYCQILGMIPVPFALFLRDKQSATKTNNSQHVNPMCLILLSVLPVSKRKVFYIPSNQHLTLLKPFNSNVKHPKICYSTQVFLMFHHKVCSSEPLLNVFLWRTKVISTHIFYVLKFAILLALNVFFCEWQRSFQTDNSPGCCSTLGLSALS